MDLLDKKNGNLGTTISTSISLTYFGHFPTFLSSMLHRESDFGICNANRCGSQSLSLYTFWAARRGIEFNSLGPFLFGALLILLVFGMIQVNFCLSQTFPSKFLTSVQNQTNAMFNLSGVYIF